MNYGPLFSVSQAVCSAVPCSRINHENGPSHEIYQYSAELIAYS